MAERHRVWPEYSIGLKRLADERYISLRSLLNAHLRRETTSASPAEPPRITRRARHCQSPHTPPAPEFPGWTRWTSATVPGQAASR